MGNTSQAAHDHLRRMELRIEHQMELIVKLRESGGDTLEAARRLVLLRNTLDEMRIQLGALAGSAHDAARASRPIAS